MPTPFESEISALLRESRNPREVADELVQRWRRRILSEPEQLDVAQYLLQAGFYPLLFEQMALLASERAKIPWAQFIDVLGRSGVKPNEIEVRALIEGAESQEGGINEFFKSPYLDLLDASLAEKKQALHQKKNLELEAKKSAFKDKLHFMRTNRLIEQEARVLEEIQALFPEAPEFISERESFQLRWAREIIANASSEKDLDLPSDLYWKHEKLSPEMTNVKTLIVEKARDLVREKPGLAYDLAVALHQMDLNGEALELLQLADVSTPAVDWFKLELMIQARQFALGLEYASDLELKYAGDDRIPDSFFAVTYARARALHGLRQTTVAVDLLRSLVRIRPQYKSAQSLLMDWSGGEV